MSGWRDTEGRTASERKRAQRETERAEFVDAVKHRPLSLVKAAAGVAFIAVLILALVLAF